MKILETRLETYPNVKLIGKRYTDADRDENGSFAQKWGQWFQNNWFSQLKGGIQGVSDDFVGLMRYTETGFEYWIGVLMDPRDPVPEGFSSVEVPGGDVAVSFVYGKEGPDIYGMEAYEGSVAAWAEHGWVPDLNAWYMERYNCPRFTQPDDQGNVVLDYCVWL
ncbi:MAG: GyrI-like domain-containing protein [Eubacteriales bacterium]|nr:GyrI-like domain-containing protein [Eubacteriales bacterium]